MITVGLTGGIGSGKTTVAKAFEALGVAIYIADDEAKKLMNNSKVIRRKLIKLFGENAYNEANTLNRPFLAKAIFNNKALLQEMNSIVHPKVGKHFTKWVKKQTSPYVIKEAAILFENGSYKNYDYIITVTAPEKVRIARVIERDNASKEKVQAIIANQWKDDLKAELSDFVIENIDLETTKQAVRDIHNILIKKQ